MPWRGHKANFCHGCGRHRSECGPLSARYKCETCGDSAAVENLHQLVAHNGPCFDHWKRRTLAAFGVFPVDAKPEAE